MTDGSQNSSLIFFILIELQCFRMFIRIMAYVVKVELRSLNLSVRKMLYIEMNHPGSLKINEVHYMTNHTPEFFQLSQLNRVSKMHST